MAWNLDQRTASQSSARDYSLDMGLRRFMLQVYNYMFVALALTGVVAYFASKSMGLMVALHGGLNWVILIGMLVMAYVLPSRIMRMTTQAGLGLFLLFSAMMGLSMSYIFLVYTGTSIVRTFLVTAVTFGAMSLYGYTTKKDLSAMGSFLLMALIGIVIASVVNIFLASTKMDFIISILGVLIFTGLTAYDTQRIREIYLSGDSMGVLTRKAIISSFTLFLNFVNLFLYLLRFMGDRR